MKKMIIASNKEHKRDREDHIRKVSRINSELRNTIQSLENQRSEAHNGDSSGSLLNVINELKYAQKELKEYLDKCRNAVNWW